MRSDAFDPSDLAALLTIPGVGTRAEWEDVGATRRMFTDGRLTQVVRGVYSRPYTVPSPRELLELYRPYIPTRSALTGWAAAVMHGVRDAGPTMRSIRPESVQLVLPRHEHRVPPGCTTLRVDLAPEDLTRIGGLPITSLARTAYDLVRFSGSDETGLTVMDCCLCELNDFPLNPELVQELVDGHPHARGNPRVRWALGLGSTRARSIPESRVRRLWVEDLGVDPSMILVNPTLRTHGTRVAEFDLVDLVSGTVVEYDSHLHAGQDQRRRDARKDVIIRDEGLGLIRLNAPDLRQNRAQLIAELTRRRAADLASGSGPRACRLVVDGRLNEEPLARYPQEP